MPKGVLPGFLFVAAGEVALLLLTFTAREIGTAVAHAAGREGPREALRRSALLFTAAARSAWLLGALGALTGFVTVLCASPGGPRRILPALAGHTLSAVLGAVLAALLGVPALRLAARALGAPAEMAGTGPEAETGARPRFRRVEAWLGAALLAALLLWPLLQRSADTTFDGASWLLNAPAWLVVVGGAVAVALYLGEAADGSSVTVGAAAAGLVGALLGLGETLVGFTVPRMDFLAGGLMLVSSSAFATLVSMAAVSLPLEDRAAMAGRRPCALGASRAAAWAFPLLALLALALVIALVLVPVERPAG